MIFAQRFTLAGKETERKNISAGIVTEESVVKRKSCVIPNTNTLPFRIYSILLGIYKAK